jgi:hypothetical protein
VLVTAAQVADSLALLVPGFVLMKAFYVLGFPTTRSDAQWVIWSILATAPLLALTNALLHGRPDWRTFPVELFTGLASGGVLALAWRGLALVAPALQREMTIRAWDLLGPNWLLVELSDGRRFRGWPKYLARSVDTDDADLFLADPAVEVGTTYTPLDTVEGLVLKRSDIKMVAVFKSTKVAVGAQQTKWSRQRAFRFGTFRVEFWAQPK